MTGDPFTRDKFAWLEGVQADNRMTHFCFRLAFVLAGYISRESGEAWPSHATLATKLCATKRGVQKAIGQLVDGGHLSVHSGRGRMVTNRYRMVLKKAKDDSPVQEEITNSGSSLGAGNGERSFVVDHAKWRTPVPEKANGHSEKGERPFVQNTMKNTLKKHTEQIAPPKRNTKKIQLPSPRFDEFWAAYPLKKGKVDAHMAYVKALEGGATESDIIKGAIRYHASKVGEDKKFIKHASGWLNGKRWLDEPDQPLNGKPASALPPDPSTWSIERWKDAILVAKRKGEWPASYGPVDRIPPDLIDPELTAIIGVRHVGFSRLSTAPILNGNAHDDNAIMGMALPARLHAEFLTRAKGSA